MRVAITGSTGLIGSALVPHLESLGHRVVRIVRTTPGPGEIGWSPSERRLDPGDLDDIDAVVHLAGAGIGDHRWTDAYKRELTDSRTIGTALLAEAIAASGGPTVLLSGSAIGFYGARGDDVLDESSAAGDGFLAELTVAWEAATAPAAAAGVRVALLRTGIVLSRDGGALKKQLPLFKLGLGGKMASGNQWQSWITIDDVVAAVAHLLTTNIAGPVNLTAPNPVTQREFATTLGNVLRRPTFVPIPKFGPKLVLGAELATALLFTGQRVVPGVLDADDTFSFGHPELDGALQHLLTAPASR